MELGIKEDTLKNEDKAIYHLQKNHWYSELSTLVRKVPFESTFLY